MDCSLARVARFHFAMLDGELGRFFYELSSAHRDRAGVWLGCASRARCRIHLATADVGEANEMGACFSFGRLPLFHLVLALCAAEVLNLRPNSPTGSATVLALIVLTIPMSIFGLAGDYGPAVTWVYFQIAVIWALWELFLPGMRFRDWAPPAVTFAVLLATYFCIPPNCGVPKYNLSQQLLDPAPLD